MNNENKIDNYFDRVKQNPTLIDIDKVHLMIAEAEAEVKAEVKKGHRNLLKFSIMTTIFAVIISAVLLWPTAQKETPNYKNQNSNAIEQTSGSMPIMKQKGNGARTTNNSSDDEIIAMDDLNKETSEDINNSLIVSGIAQVDQESFATKLPNGEMPIDFDIDTFELVDGSKYVLKLSKEELEKIGFQEINDNNKKPSNMGMVENHTYAKHILDSTSFINLNQIQLEKLGFQYFNERIEFRFNFQSNEMGTYWTEKTQSVGLINPEDNSQFLSKSSVKNLLLMHITNESGGGYLRFNFPNESLKTVYYGNFNSEKIFLIPIRIKKHIFENEYPKYDIIYWFLPTKEFFERLPRNIDNALTAEYKYITAEDKSTLVKPECKYFDECKNTLELSNFKAFPNPANERVTVSFELPETIDARISLVDLAGRERQILQPQTQFAAGSHQLDFDLSFVAEGIYLLTLYSDKGVQTQRLIVTR